jgi:hypothetical protein
MVNGVKRLDAGRPDGCQAAAAPVLIIGSGHAQQASAGAAELPRV